MKKSLGHYVENTGDTDLVMFEVFKADRFAEVSLSDWLTHTPPQMIQDTLNISRQTLRGSRTIVLASCRFNRLDKRFAPWPPGT